MLFTTGTVSPLLITCNSPSLPLATAGSPVDPILSGGDKGGVAKQDNSSGLE